MAASPDITPDAPKPRKKIGKLRWIVGVIVCLVLMLTWSLFFTNDLRALEVISGSMDPTLIVGDRLIVWDLEKEDPKRGDVVVLESPDDDGPELVKRVIGIPGDTVSSQHGVFYLNNAPSGPPDGGKNFHPGAQNYTHTLAPGEYYLLGDNRTVSHDSSEFGPVNRQLIHGRVVYRYAPLGRFGKVQ
ncbi:signal peptidase I [soil metagenome]